MTVVICPFCGGSGGGDDYYLQCHFCNGTGGVDVRDQKGRFLPYEAAYRQMDRRYRDIKRQFNKAWDGRMINFFGMIP